MVVPYGDGSRRRVHGVAGSFGDVCRRGGGTRGLGAASPTEHARRPLNTALAVVVHTGGYLLVTGVVAWIIYWKLGLALLRTAWLNLDLVWAVALMATGCFTLLL